MGRTNTRLHQPACPALASAAPSAHDHDAQASSQRWWRRDPQPALRACFQRRRRRRQPFLHRPGSHLAVADAPTDVKKAFCKDEVTLAPHIPLIAVLDGASSPGNCATLPLRHPFWTLASYLDRRSWRALPTSLRRRHLPDASQFLARATRALTAPAAWTAGPCRAARSDDRARRRRGGPRARSARCRPSRGYWRALGRVVATAEAKAECFPGPAP